MSEEKKVEIEEKRKEPKSKFGKFMKKNGFYIGMFLIIVLVIIVVGSDNDSTLKGNVSYDEKVIYVDHNNLYVKEDDKDAKLLTANIMAEYNSTQISKILLMCKTSEDNELIYYFDNVVLDNSTYTGDLNVYQNNKSKTIAKGVDLSYALSTSLDKVVYAKAAKDKETNLYTYDLYVYEDGKDTLIESDVDSECYTISGDGHVIYYHKGFYSDTNTTSLYVYQNGSSKKIDSQSVYYYKEHANGTFLSNWPMTNYDGSKVLYAGYAGENTLPSLKLYTAASSTSTVLTDSFVQVFADESLDYAVINGNINTVAYVGDMLKVNLNTLENEVMAKDIWALLHLDVAKYVSDDYFDFKFYFKNFDEITSTANLCFLHEDGSEDIALPSVNVDEVTITDDYDTVYALGYYYVAEGGELTKFYDLTTDSYQSEYIDESVSEYHIDDANTVLGYRKDVKLYLIDKKDRKKMIDNHDVAAFEVTDDGNLLYFFKEGEIGSGEVYVMETDIDKDYVLADKDSTFIYEFADDKVAYITGFLFSTESGKLVVTDGKGNYEIIAETASTLLMKNYIK